MAWYKAGGGGVKSDEVTATKAQVLEGETAVTHDSDDEAGVGTLPKDKVMQSAGGNIAPGSVLSSAQGAGGTIQTKNDSGNVTLSAGSDAQSKSYPAGYYPNAHGAAITLEEKSVTPGTSAQNVTPTSGKVLSKVAVGAIPNQKSDSGNVTLTSASATKSYAAGYYANAHGATVPVYTGG